MPFGRFFNNSAHSVGRFGIWIFEQYNPSPSGNCRDTALSPAVFDRFTSYGSDMGAEYTLSNPIQFKNFVMFDHSSAGIESKTVILNENPNNQYIDTNFYSATTGSAFIDSIIIGNSDSSSPNSITPAGIIVIEQF
jgi:hypothetical protein